MLITLKNIYKIIGGDELFESLNFELKPGQKTGLVGRNGSGKSTLFRILTKEEPVDGGDVFIQKGLTIGYLKQIPEEGSQTGYEYLQSAFDSLLKMLQDMKQLEAAMVDPEKMDTALKKYGELQECFTREGGYEMDSLIDQVANGLQIKPLLNQSFADFSGGEKTKLGLAKILLEKPDVLLLDEPTNHLDLQAIEWLERYIQQYNGAVCMVSHDRSFLDHTVTEIMELESGEVDCFQGNYSSYEKQKEEKLIAEFHQYQEQQKKIKKMKEAIKRLRQWANEANPPNPKLFKKAKSMEKALGRMEKMDKPVIDPKTMNLTLDASRRTGKDVLVAEEVTKSYGSRMILSGVDVHIRYKERLALVGGNGSGKSTLLRLLLAQESPDSGVVKIGPSVEFGYLPQNPLQEADPDQRMIDYFRTHIRVTEGEARHQLAAFMFYGFDVFKKISHLSGGERMRLKLAVFMHQGINVLVLDEPTNHLDIESQEVLEEAVRGFEGTVVGVSHDRYFLNQCFTHTSYMVKGKLHRYIGTYNETRHHWDKWLEQEQRELEYEKSSTKKLTPLQQEKTAEEQIEALETQLSELNKEIQAAKGLELEDLHKQKERMDQQVEQLYEEWMDKS